MRVVQRFAFARLLLVAATAVGCGGDGSGITGPPDPPTPNFVRLQSDPQDCIGQGRSYEYTQANAVIRLTATGRH